MKKFWKDKLIAKFVTGWGMRTRLVVGRIQREISTEYILTFFDFQTMGIIHLYKN